MTQRQFEALLGPLLPRLYRLAYRFCGDGYDAEDLLQDVLVKLYPQRQSLAKLDKPLPWISKVMYREFIDGHRRRTRRLRLIQPLEESGIAGDEYAALAGADDEPEQSVDQGQLRQKLQAVMAQLSEEHRVLLTLFEMEGYSLEELCQILELPKGTVKSRLHRARARLRELLAVEPDITAGRVNNRGIQ